MEVKSGKKSFVVIYCLSPINNPAIQHHLKYSTTERLNNLITILNSI